MTIGIYRIVNNVNGKCYVGQSSNIEERWKEHLRKLRGNSHHSVHLQRAWNLFGEPAFTFEVYKVCLIENLDSEELKAMEIFNVCENGYNISRDPVAFMRGRHHSEDSKRAISQSMTGKKRNPESAKIGGLS